MLEDVSPEVVMSLRVHPGLAPLGVVTFLAQRIEPCLSQVGQAERVRLRRTYLLKDGVGGASFRSSLFAAMQAVALLLAKEADCKSVTIMVLGVQIPPAAL